MPRAKPLWELLEPLLAPCKDLHDLEPAQRRQALAWYRQAHPDDLARLTPGSLLKLARLLKSAALVTRALHIYQLLVRTHPQSAEAREAVAEASRYAVEEKYTGMAEWFANWATEHTVAEPPAAARASERFVPSLAEATPASAATSVARPAAPRRSLGELLAGFMEERNILWGELVGGLLIVGCSIALVISLWQTLEQIPYSPYLIIASITAALFGAGHYTLNHWKLESTSRGLLVIATLLTPLDFLVVAGLSRGTVLDPAWLGPVIEVVSLAMFGLLLLASARVLVGALPCALGRPEHWLTLAVLGGAGSQLLVPRWLDPDQQNGFLLALAFVPVACQVLALAAVLLPLARRDRLDGAAANALFLYLGQATFTTAVALGFLAYWVGDPLAVLQDLAMPLAAAGMPILITGALVHRLLEQAPPEPATETPGQRGLSPAVARLVGTVTTLTGMLVMLGALVLTWPRPEGLLVIGAVNAVAFTAAALRYRLPPAHVPALVCLAVAALVALHGLAGNLPAAGPDAGEHLLQLAAGPSSGGLLMGLAVVLALAAELCLRCGRRPDGLYQTLGCGAAAGLALLLTGRVGDTEPGLAALVFGVGGVGCLLLNLRWRDAAVCRVGAAVLLGATGFTLVWADPNISLPRLILLALLIEATWLLGLSFFLGRTLADRDSVFAATFLEAGLALSVLAAVTLPVTLEWDWLPACSLCALWLAGLWLATAWFRDWPPLFQIFQGALTVAVVLGISAWLGEQSWVMETLRGLSRPLSLQAYTLGLSVLSLAWAAVRRSTRPRSRFRDLLDPGDWTVDRAVFAGVLVVQLLLCVWAVLPGINREHWPSPLPEVKVGIGDFDPGWAWLTLSVLGLSLTMSLWEGWPRESAFGWLTLGLTLPVLAAYAFHDERAVASALRWGLALAFLGYSVLLWLRRPLEHGLSRLGIPGPEAANVLSQWLRGGLLLGTLLPVLLLTSWVAIAGFSGRPPVGPLEDSVFDQMGWTVSVVVPLLLLALGLVGHGAREDEAGYIAGAGHLLTVTLMGGYALGVVTGGGRIAGAEAAFLMQLGVLAAAGWGLIWLSLGRWRRLTLIVWQPTLSLIGCLGIGLFALLALLARPVNFPTTPVPEFVTQAGHLLGWVGLLGTIALYVWWLRLAGRAQESVHVLGLGGFLLGVLTACAVAPWDADGWLAVHTLTLTWAAASFSLLACGWAASRDLRMWTTLRRYLPMVPTCSWAEGLGALVVLLAVGGATADPARPYWSGVVLTVVVLLGVDAVWSRRPGLVYASGLLVNVAGFTLWQYWQQIRSSEMEVPPWQSNLFDRFVILQVLLQVLCFAVASACWLFLELRLRRLEPPIDLRGRWLPFAHAAALAAVHLLGLMILLGLVGDLTGIAIRMSRPLAWAALTATVAAVILCFWDSEAERWGLPVAALYFLGLMALGLGLHGLSLTPRDLSLVATPSLAGSLAVFAAAAAVAPHAAPLWRSLRIPTRPDNGLVPWFVPSQTLLGLLTLGLSVWLCLDFPTTVERLAGPAAVALLTLACLTMTGYWQTLSRDGAPLPDSEVPRQVTLTLALLAALELGWAWLGADVPVPWLHRNVILLAVLTVAVPLYRSNLAGYLNRDGAWAASARRQGPVLTTLALGVLAVVLVQEFLLYDRAVRRVPLAWPGVLLVTALLAGVLVGCLWTALTRRPEPFGLRERGRMGCVYAAEVLLVLLLVHVRLSIPYLLPSIGQYWTLVLMAVGFGGVGLAELCRRRGLPVLAGPLQQTGLFLPLVPLLAFLIQPLPGLDLVGNVIPGFDLFYRHLERLHQNFGLHALLWFLLGLLYVFVAVLRRSSVFALLAALAANFGLWVIYGHSEGLAFVLHPQLWLVPLGLIVLTAEHLNRDRLTEAQSQAVRYLGLLLIYLSSTADLFITRLGNSVVLPVILAVLSVAGVLVGILLRVRAFLLLGVAFLCLVVFSQIWHAAVDREQTWVWWASGIVLGAAILTLFALFEKRRNDVLRVFEEIKGWR